MRQVQHRCCVNTGCKAALTLAAISRVPVSCGMPPSIRLAGFRSRCTMMCLLRGQTAYWSDLGSESAHCAAYDALLKRVPASRVQSV